MNIPSAHQEYYLSVQLEDIPWSRMVHWYGRATDYSEVFQQLFGGTDQAKILIQKISNEIEHQDGIMMVTPFALIFLCRVLPFLQPEDQQFLRQQIKLILESAQYQLDSYDQQDIPTVQLSPQDLVREPYLWPEFVSDEIDGELWDEFDWGDEYYYRLVYCFEIVETYLGA